MRAVLFSLVLSLVLVGCGSTIMDRPVRSQAKGWTIVLLKVTDGPDEYGRGMERLVAADDQRFLWFKIRLHNDQPTEQVFNYERCDIDLGEQAILPVLVDMDKAINILVEGMEETLAPGEEIERNLIIAFPEEKYPTRLQCGELLMPLALDGT